MNKKDIPNYLTFVRLVAALAMLVIAALSPAQKGLIFWLFALGALTDLLDGHLARKWKATSPLGTMLDPIADKLLVVAALLYLLKYTITPLAAVGLIIGREIYVSGLREYLALKKIKLPVSAGGKWKTALQLIAIVLMLGTLSYPMPFLRAGNLLLTSWNIGVLLLWVSAILALVSAVDYTRKSAGALR